MQQRKPQSVLFILLKYFAWFLDLFPFSPTRKKPTYSELCKQASKECGISATDYDTSLWRNSVEAYLDDTFAHKDNPLSKLSARSEVKEQIVRRARVLHTLRQNPEIEDTSLPRPIFIVGMPRTGSTILHQMLAQDPKAMAIPYWKWNDPVPPEQGKPDKRLAKARGHINMLKFCSPELPSIHLTEAHEVDECHAGWIDFLFAVRSSFRLIPGLHKSYELFWNSDLNEMYSNQRRVLKMLKWQTEEYSECDWMMLKCPLHTIALDNLFSEFPESSLVWTHRDMKSVVCSVVGLMLVGDISSMPNTADLSKLGRKSLDFLKTLMDRGLKLREKMERNGVEFIDFYYSDFIQSPIDAISGLYQNLSLTLTETAKNNIQEYYLASVEARKHSKKPIRFSLEQLSLDPNEVDNVFSNYYSRFPKAKQ